MLKSSPILCANLKSIKSIIPSKSNDPNLYLFRNMITGKVIISRKFELENSDLQQIGEHRRELKIRRDHWVPFAVIEGYNETLMDFLSKPLTNHFKNPIGKYRLPLSHQEPNTNGWMIPTEVKEKIITLCRLLSKEKTQDLMKEKGIESLKIHWERDEYKDLAADAELLWPQFVDHTKLTLIRNRFPIVNGLNFKRLINKK